MSTNSTTAGTFFFGFTSSLSRSSRGSGTSTTPTLGSTAENYPFCTVEPNVGVVEVPDPRLERLNELVKPKKKVPAVVEFVDIAGLVQGASQGEGLGNQTRD